MSSPASTSSTTAFTRSPTGRSPTPRVTITTQLDPLTRDRAARIAIALGRSFASIVREALDKLADEYEGKAAHEQKAARR